MWRIPACVPLRALSKVHQNGRHNFPDVRKIDDLAYYEKAQGLPCPREGAESLSCHTDVRLRHDTQDGHYTHARCGMLCRSSTGGACWARGHRTAPAGRVGHTFHRPCALYPCLCFPTCLFVVICGEVMIMWVVCCEPRAAGYAEAWRERSYT